MTELHDKAAPPIAKWGVISDVIVPLVAGAGSGAAAGAAQAYAEHRLTRPAPPEQEHVILPAGVHTEE